MQTNSEKQISLRFTGEEYDLISQLATKRGVSVTALLKQEISNSLGLPASQISAVTLKDVDEAAEKLVSGQQFKIKQLFNINDWQNFSKASRLSVGRTFFTNVDRGNFVNKYKFVQKDSDNAAIYERL